MAIKVRSVEVIDNNRKVIATDLEVGELKFPNTKGEAGQVLTDDGLGNLTLEEVAETTVSGGAGIEVIETNGDYEVSADIDTNSGLEVNLSDEIAVKLGAGLSFDADGKIEAVVGGLTLAGDCDVTSATLIPGAVNGEIYANTGDGNFSTEWAGVTRNADELTEATSGDLMVYDDSNASSPWIHFPRADAPGTDLGLDNKGATTLDVTSSTGDDVTLPAATTSEAGLMTAADKDKLDNLPDDIASLADIGDGAINIDGGSGIAATGDNATANQATDTTRTLSVKTGDGLTIDSNGNVIIDPNFNLDGNVTAPGDGAINIDGGDGITATGDNATANQSGDTTRTLSVKTGDGLTIDANGNVIIDPNYNLDGNVNLPTVGEADITLADADGNEIGVFNVNESNDDTITLPDYVKVGGNVGDLNNDAGYITDAGVTKIIAGTGIEIDPTAGTGEVTINSTVTGLEFAGNVDVTDETTIPVVRSANQLYVNIGQGAFHPDWAAITNNAEDTDTANPGDFMLLDTNTTDSDPWSWIEGGTPPSSDGTWIDDGAGNLYPATLTNNVGIGTTSPSVNLEVSSDLPWFRLTDSDDASTCDLLNNGGKLSIRADEGKKSSSSYIDIRVQADEKMRIKSNGNVGIGTTSPAAQLDVVFNGDDAIVTRREGTGNASYQNISIGCSVAGNRLVSNYHSSNAKGLSVIINDQDNAGNAEVHGMTLSHEGYIGVGNTSRAKDPKYPLVVSATNVRQFVAGQGKNDNYVLIGAKNVTSNAYLTIESYATNFNVQGVDDAMIIKETTGNVGIGTDAPAHKLDVDGDLNATNYRIDLLQELV